MNKSFISGLRGKPEKPVASRLKIALTALLVLAAATYAVQSMALEPGSAAPSFDLAGTSGQIKLAGYRGKLVYLDFWASWCSPCKRSFPWMNQMQTQFGAQGLQVIAVNLDAKRRDASDFLAATPANFLIGFDSDGALARLYEIKGMPSSVLVDPDGRVIATHIGFSDTDKTELENLIGMNVRRMGK